MRRLTRTGSPTTRFGREQEGADRLAPGRALRPSSRLADVHSSGRAASRCRDRLSYCAADDYGTGAALQRPRHQHKAIEAVLREAEAAGWRVVHSPGGHVWGLLRCGERSRAGCQVSIFSTPRIAEGHARRIARDVQRCNHGW